jgi:hypothetical protein
MFKQLFLKRAQSTLEYAILIGVIVAGLITMQVYLKRGYSGKLRESGDSMGKQFSPGQTYVNITTVSNTNSTEVLGEDYVDHESQNVNLTEGASYTDIKEQTTTRNATEQVDRFGDEVWWGGNWTDNSKGSP